MAEAAPTAMADAEFPLPLEMASAPEPASAVISDPSLAVSETAPAVIRSLSATKASIVETMMLPEPEPAPAKAVLLSVPTTAAPASVSASMTGAPAAEMSALAASTVEPCTPARTVLPTTFTAIEAPMASDGLSPEAWMARAAPPASAEMLESSEADSVSAPPAFTVLLPRIRASAVLVTTLTETLPAPAKAVPLLSPLTTTPATLMATESMSLWESASRATAPAALIVLPSVMACTEFSTTATVTAPPMPVSPENERPPAIEMSPVSSEARSSTPCAGFAPVLVPLIRAPAPK